MRRRLQQIPRRLFAFDGDFIDQAEHRFGRVGFRFKFKEGKIGLRARLLHDGIHVQLAAHARDPHSRHVVTRGQPIAGKIAIAPEQAHRAASRIHGVNAAVRAEEEQAAGRGRQLVLHADVRRQNHTPGHRHRVVGLQADGAAGVGEIVYHAVDAGVGLYVGIDQVAGIARNVLDVQLAGFVQNQLPRLRQQAAAGNGAGIDFKALRLADIHHRAGLVHQFEHQSFRGKVEPVDGFVGRVRGFRRERIQADAHQRIAVFVGDVPGLVLGIQARGVDAPGDQRLPEILQVDHVKVAAAGFVRAEKQHAIGIDAYEGIGIRPVDGLRLSGQEEAALAVGIRRDRAAADHRVRLRHGEGRNQQTQREHENDCADFLHNYALLCVILPLTRFQWAWFLILAGKFWKAPAVRRPPVSILSHRVEKVNRVRTYTS